MRRIAAISTLLLLAGFISAQPTDHSPARIALVVGNASYDGDAALKNPVNDATDVATQLKLVGWSVTLVTNADRRVFNRAVVSFRESLAANEGANALFYYAGHGMQVDAANYLIPVKTPFETIDDIKADAISIQSVTSAIEQAKASVSLVILDACRDNPFAKKMTRSLGGSRGLTVVQSGGGARGSAIMFSTSPGDVAMDGAGRNGIFTAALLKYINSDMKIEELFKKVTADVRSQSADSQKPWINASLSSDFYFVSDEVRAIHAAEAAKAAELLRQAELTKAAAAAAEAARASEAANTALARAEAEAAKKATAEALAAKAKAEADAKTAADQAAIAAAKVAAVQNLPKGKVRIESSVAGSVYLGKDLLGEVGPDSPLVADSLVTGKQDFRLVSAGKPDEVKSTTITDKAYSTVVFGKKPQAGASNAAQALLNGQSPATVAVQNGPAAMWIRKAVGQRDKLVVSFIRQDTSETMQYSGAEQFPVSIEPGSYLVTAQLADDTEATFTQVYQVGGGGSLVVELPTLVYSTNFANSKLLNELVLKQPTLEKNLQNAKDGEIFFHSAGWITFGIGIAGVLVTGFGLIDGLIAKSSYQTATTAADAAKLRSRGQLDSQIFAWAAPFAGGYLLLSVPMLLADLGIGNQQQALDDNAAKIQTLGGQK